MPQERFSMTTQMSPKDYRRFLYIATFLRSPAPLIILGLMSLLGAISVSLILAVGSLWVMGLIWVFMAILAGLAVCLKVERRNKARLKTDKTGTFESKSTLIFEPDKIIFDSPATVSHGELYYHQFFQLLETKDYYIFYLTQTQATLVCKRDIPEEDSEAFNAFIHLRFKGKSKTLSPWA